MKTKDQLVSLGLTEIKAEEIMLLESKMLEQAVKFQYKKKDGSIRDAEGTLDPKKMILSDGTKYEFKGAVKDNDTQFCYFDLGKKLWRSFNVFNLIAVEG